MKKKINLKDLVKEKYAEIVTQQSASECGCACGCGPAIDYSIFSDDYTKLEGYNPDADLSLGCGIPTDVAAIKPGHTVLDLGSGAGNDCFVARSLVGETGKVIGLDFTEEMISKARENNNKLGFQNVEFILGDIENMPISDNSIDVVISNCVLNLVPDKDKAFSEIFRVMKKGGHLSISDVVLEGILPEKLLEEAVMYAGCVSGALQMIDYIAIIENSGFTSVEIKKQKKIDLPEELLSQFLSTMEIEEFKDSKTGIFSITVFGVK